MAQCGARRSEIKRKRKMPGDGFKALNQIARYPLHQERRGAQRSRAAAPGA